MRRTVQDVMTREVVVAHPETPFKELARLMHEHRIGAVPVLDDVGQVAGVVSESDLALKEMERDGWSVARSCSRRWEPRPRQ